MTDRLAAHELTRLGDLFDQAVALADSDRAELLSTLELHEPAMATALRDLLLQDTAPGNPLDVPLDALVGALVEGRDPINRVGPYRIIREVGRGGMGTVYLAQREDGQFEQRVAIKLVKRGMDSDEIVARFRSERQILARLEHPHIGRLYDGGVAEDGRPYLAMEFIDGRPITHFADSQSLPLDQRIELFSAAAAAVRFAHSNLVVHRDLKPSNVMVTNDGVVKLLDFGIAKLLDPNEASASRTHVGQRVLTPAYAAPEQIEGGPITTATDVFSLGVLLHELLTGLAPAWKSDDPVPASTTLSRIPDVDSSGSTTTREDVSRLRGTTGKLLAATLSGDLDAILAKALERDPARRYGSVDALIDDLQRYSDGRTVGARAPSTLYRLARFARRNRLAVGASAAVVVALSAGMGMAVHQRNVAVAERNAAELVTAYLEGMFESINPIGSDPGADTLRVGDFLERSTQAALAELEDDPALRARLLATLGRAHMSLGDPQRAWDVWTQSVEASRMAGEPAPLPVMIGLGEAATALAQWNAADSVLVSAIGRAREEQDDSGLLGALRNRAASLIRRDAYTGVDPLLSEAEELAIEQDNQQLLADILIMQGALAISRGDLEGAMDTQHRATEIFREVRGPEDLQVAISLTNLGGMQRANGDLEAAERSLAEALQIVDLRISPQHGIRIGTLNAYGNVLSNQGMVQRADSMFAAAEEVADTPENRQLLVQVLSNHSANRRVAGDTAGSLQLAARAAEVAEAVYREGPGVMDPLVMYAIALDFAGDSVEADAQYARAAEAGADIPASYPGRVIADRGVARRLGRQGEHQAAEVLMLELLSRTPETTSGQGRAFRTRQATLRELATLYRRWGRLADASRIDEQKAQEAAAAEAAVDPGGFAGL